MKLAPPTLFLFYICLFLSSRPATAMDFSGEMTTEVQLFFHSPSFKGQKHHRSSALFTSEFYQEFESGSSFIFSPMLRLDASDSERSHFDIRELNYHYVADNWEIKTGISKVFWGATEFIHMVDIINQTDLVEGMDMDEKLGQPMVHLSVVKPWGVVDGFLLPVFRERTFPGTKGRLRAELTVDRSLTEYQSDKEQYHLDFALRYSHTISHYDFGIYQFFGTNREPILQETISESAEQVLSPYYQQIQQTGLDFQMVLDEWLLKGEALHRSGQGRDFAASTFGFEYTLYGVLGTSTDLGIIAEYVFDDRDDTIPTVYDNDILFGLRWTANDIDDSQILIGVARDTQHSSTIYTFEASRRLGSSFKLRVNGVVFHISAGDIFATGIEDDDFIKLECVFYF